jgi:hypothetical protein
MQGARNRMTFTNSFTAVTAASGSSQTKTIPGLLSGRDEILRIHKATHQAGLSLSAFVSADNTLTVRFVNATASDITPTASDTYTIVIDRYDSAPPTSVDL